MKNPFTNSTNILIRLLRSGSDAKDAKKDDMICIDVQGEDLYHLYYRDGDMKDPDTAHMTALTGDELDSYLYSLFFLLTRDSDPFRSVQINVPCFPLILLDLPTLKKKSVRETLNLLLPTVHSCLKVNKRFE